jgi:hypothetical protein
MSKQVNEVGAVDAALRKAIINVWNAAANADEQHSQEMLEVRGKCGAEFAAMEAAQKALGKRADDLTSVAQFADLFYKVTTDDKTGVAAKKKPRASQLANAIRCLPYQKAFRVNIANYWRTKAPQGVRASAAFYAACSLIVEKSEMKSDSRHLLKAKEADAIIHGELVKAHAKATVKIEKADNINACRVDFAKVALRMLKLKGQTAATVRAELRKLADAFDADAARETVKAYTKSIAKVKASEVAKAAAKIAA